MRRFWIAPLLFGLSALFAGVGCGNVNPVVLIAYLFNGNDPKDPAKFPLKPRPKHEEEEVKVVVLTTCAQGLSSDVMGVDRALASEFIKLLQERCTENKEKVLVKRVTAIDEFKKKNPDWQGLSPVDIGKELKADYIIDIEVLDMTLYEEGSRKEFLHGRCHIAVTAFDLAQKSTEPAFAPPDFNLTYPSGHPMSVYDENVSTFKQKFIKRIAGELVLPFTAHSSEQRVLVD
jgi:hypothetical protein